MTGAAPHNNVKDCAFVRYSKLIHRRQRPFWLSLESFPHPVYNYYFMRMITRFALLSLAVLPAVFTASAGSFNFGVNAADVQHSRITKRIPLAAFTMPAVRITNVGVQALAQLPKGDTAVASPDAEYHFTPFLKVVIGQERKQPFALVSLPAYYRNAQGQLAAIRDFDIEVTEGSAPQPVSFSALAKGTEVNSPLATGTWYKIAVPGSGVYKIDYAFLTSKLGISGAGINASAIRLYGSGGQMISENNAIAHDLGLTENAIQMNDGGDGVFGAGDYFLFYAPGITTWTADAAYDRFIHKKNVYADSAYYFINVDGGTAGLRMSNAIPPAGAANETVSTFSEYQLHENDLYNPGKFGKDWYGEKYGNYTTQGLNGDVNFNVGAGVDSLRARIITADATSAGGGSFSFALNGQGIYSTYFSALGGDEPPPVDKDTYDVKLPLTGSGSAAFHLTYAPSVADGTAYLDFIEINYRRPLSFTNGMMPFRDLRSVGAGNVAAYQVQNANGNLQVWDVTNPRVPQKIQGTLSGSTYTFSQDAGSLHEFAAFDGSNFATPVYMGTVANQNIHGHGAVDFIIVTAPEFMTAANKLADFHRERDGLRTLVVTPAQVYNEFSSGGQDLTAIRDMARFFYLRAGNDTAQMPRYMLLFGDASYDYKNRIGSNTNFVPTYESDESVNPGGYFAVDEYYGFLDDNENINNLGIPNTIDMSTGRLPVHTAAEANAVVSKIIGYTSPSSFGPWKLRNTYIGDNEDGAGDHLLDANAMCATVDATSQLYNDDKIYLDNLPFVSTPAGIRCPDANKAINDDIYKGTFLINYNGHGNTQTLAHERILTATDFNTWKNISKLPFMITATCDFARFDDPAYVSAGENLCIKSDGGAIALLTTTAAVYAGSNATINTDYLSSQFHQNSNGSWPTFGDAYRIGKNKTYTGTQIDVINFRRFVLLGDPALQPCFPKLFVHTDSLTDLYTQGRTDTLKALGTYRLDGHVSDAAGMMLNSFNGRAYVTIYDKPRKIHLLTKEGNDPRDYTLRDNIIYKGIATVTNGDFSLEFIAPKDLNYDFGKAKVSYYAENGVTDAAGSDSSITSGGYSSAPFSDNDAPLVQPFMNDSLFRDGGITGASTLLFVKLSDASGINVSGNSVGHDLNAILDGNVGEPYNLNDYYETAPNTYKRGYVRFPIAGLADGDHTFLVRAWDVANNSGEGTVHFTVKDGAVVAVQNLVNYPNPFTDATHFFFEHNHPNEAMHIQVAIFGVDGRVVRILEQDFTPDGSHSNEIAWDGTDATGAKLQGGVYPYKMTMSTATGIKGSAYQKLVIVR